MLKAVQKVSGTLSVPHRLMLSQSQKVNPVPADVKSAEKAEHAWYSCVGSNVNDPRPTAAATSPRIFYGSGKTMGSQTSAARGFLPASFRCRYYYRRQTDPSSGSDHPAHPHEAEEAAIVLAIAHNRPPPSNIYSDSIGRGHISYPALLPTKS